MLSASDRRMYGAAPASVVVVTAEHGGVRNLMAVASHLALGGDPPRYGVLIGHGKATHPLIVANGRFGVNFLPLSHAAQVHGSGLYSLHNGQDKFALLGLDTLPDAPLALQAAYLHYACRVVECHPLGGHDLFVGEVEDVRHDPDCFDGDGLFTGQTALHLGRGVYVGGGGERRAARLPEPL